MTASPSQPFDISWGDFEMKGFSDEFDSDTFSLFSEVGRPSMDENTTTSQQQRPQKLKKPYPYASLASKQLHSEAMYRGGLDIEHDEKLAAYEIKEIRKVKIDPIFSEMYLDSLEDPKTVTGWPNFMVAELKNSSSPYRAVVIELVKPDPPISEPEIVHPSTSMTSIHQVDTRSSTKQKQRRSLFSLSSRKKRHSTVTGTKGKVASKAEGNLAHISELGVWTPGPPSQATSDTASDKHDAKRVRQEGPSSLPMQIRSQTVPIIVKTSPLTPPRRCTNDVIDRASPAAASPVEHAEIDHRSSPSPSDSAASLGKKVSRKAVPELFDEDVFLAEVSKEAVSPDNRQDVQQEGLASAIADATDHKSQQSETADAELVLPMEPIHTKGSGEANLADASPVLLTEAPVTSDVVYEATSATKVSLEERDDQPKRTDDKEDAVPRLDKEAFQGLVSATPSEYTDNSYTGTVQESRASMEPALKHEMVIPTVVIEDADSKEESSLSGNNAPNAINIIGEPSDAGSDVSISHNVEGTSNEAIEPIIEVSQMVDTPLTADEQSYPSPPGLPSTIELREEVDYETETADFIEPEDQKVDRGDNLAQAPPTEETLAADATKPAEEPKENAEESESLTKLNCVSDIGQSPNSPEPVLDGSGEESGIAQSKAEDAENQPKSASSTPKRFGSTLNRVSPSLKERFGSGKGQKSPEHDKPGDKTPKPQEPPSPSRRAALLSGAKKMLSRKKSNPSGIGAVLPPSPDPVPPVPEQTAGHASAEPAAVHQHPKLQYAMNTVHVNPDELSGSSADDPLLNDIADEEQRSIATAVTTSTNLHIPNSYGEDQLVAASSPNIDVLPLRIPSVPPAVSESGDVGTRAPSEDSSSHVDQEMQITNDVKSIDDVAETQGVTDASDDEGSAQEPTPSARSTVAPDSMLQGTIASDSDGLSSTAESPLPEEAAVTDAEGMPDPRSSEAYSEKKHRKSSSGIDSKLTIFSECA